MCVSEGDHIDAVIVIVPPFDYMGGLSDHVCDWQVLVDILPVDVQLQFVNRRRAVPCTTQPTSVGLDQYAGSVDRRIGLVAALYTKLNTFPRRSLYHHNKKCSFTAIISRPTPRLLSFALCLEWINGKYDTPDTGCLECYRPRASVDTTTPKIDRKHIYFRNMPEIRTRYIP